MLYTDPAGNFRDLVVDPAGDRVLIADYAAGIQRLNLAGTWMQTYAAANVWGLALDAANSVIYFTDYAAGEIRAGLLLILVILDTAQSTNTFTVTADGSRSSRNRKSG